MHIVLVSSTADPSTGWGTVTHNHALTLWRQGVSFTLLLPRHVPRVDAEFKDSVRYALPELPLTFHNYRAFWKIIRLWMPISYAGPSPTIVHSLVDFPYAMLGWRLAKKTETPFFLNAIGTYSVAPFMRLPDRWLSLPVYRDAARVIAISDYTARAMVLSAGYPRTILIRHLPVAYPVLPGVEDMSIIDALPPGKRIVLTIASRRINDRKGFDVLLRAFPDVVRAVPDAHLVAIGADPSHASPNVTAIPHVSAARLAALFSRCAVFAALPRRVGDYFEGYGLVYLEAGLYRRPVVATRSGGIPEVVQNGVTGILVPENDPVAAARAMVVLLRDVSLSHRYGEAGYVLAHARNWDSYMRDMVMTYEQAVLPRK